MRQDDREGCSLHAALEKGCYPVPVPGTAGDGSDTSEPEVDSIEAAAETDTSSSAGLPSTANGRKKRQLKCQLSNASTAASEKEDAKVEWDAVDMLLRLMAAKDFTMMQKPRLCLVT